MRKDGFVLREFRGIRYYSCKAFGEIPNLCHGFSTRDGGSGIHDRSFNLSYSSWDSAERVDENRRRFLSALNLENSTLATLRQVHSNRVYIIKDNSGEWNESEGDALATTVENVALAVKVADCLPVLIADPVRLAVAAVHCGWRGTLSCILFHTILEMQKGFGSNASDLLVAVGPGIRSCCFEVASEVSELFERQYPDSRLTRPVMARPGKYLLDLSMALDAQLDRAGVRMENRFDLGECTVCSRHKFFSYRAEGSATGRMMAVIGWNTGLLVKRRS